MPKFCANLSFLFAEQPFSERFRAAAAAGFRGVEYLFPYDYPAEALAGWLREAGLEQVLFNLPAGDWAAGERGLACLPGREAEFRQGVELALTYAKALDCRRLHCLAGLRPAGVPEERVRATWLANLRHAADRLAEGGVQLLIEPINSRIDMPGYWLDTPAKAFALLAEIGRPNVAVQFDIYHAQVMAGDLARSIETHIGRIGHFQVADNPGRHEPGSGEINYPHLFTLLDRLGYGGWVGCEYKPLNSTLAGLGWAETWLRPAKEEKLAGTPDELLRRMFAAALAAADPARCLPAHLPPQRGGRLIVVGAGKAAAAMAQAVERHWPGELAGLVVTRYGHGLPCERIEVVEAAHPLPDAAGAGAAARILERVRGLDENDCVLALLSGGGSALLAAPAPGVALAAKQAVTAALLRSGASIAEINCVRKHLSAVKGGRLAAAAWPARVLTLAVSDVPGDDPDVIASGPTVPDPTTCADALAVLARYRIDIDPDLRRRLESGELETPKPGDPRLSRSDFRLVASPSQMLQAAAAAARAAGVTPLILGDAIEGEAREVARALAGMALSCARHHLPAPPPCVLLSGGETTVTLRGRGRGGRNSEFLLALALALDGAPGIHALAADTDGIDGSEDNAGAFVRPDTLARARAAGVSARRHLDDNDAWGFFSALDDLLLTGPTRTNVNDFRAILVGAK